MPPHRPPVPKAPEPTKVFFDPFNSSSTGHQRAENRLSGSTSWRDLRSYKLSHQFRDTSGRGGHDHLSDLVGAGKENGGGDVGAPGLREKGWQDIRGLMAGTRKRSSGSLGDEDVYEERKRLKRATQSSPKTQMLKTTAPDSPKARTCSSSPKGNSHVTDQQLEESLAPSASSSPPPPQIFRNLNIYLNGSTAPLISDHKLKQLFAQHGGNASISLGRRTVTHVIIGDKCGGGLASGKIQKEISTVSGKGIKFVTAQWVLDSVEKGIRQPEARYSPTILKGRIGGSGQGSVRTMLMKSRLMNN